MTTPTQRLDAVDHWTDGIEPMGLAELLEPADVYWDPASEPTEVVPGLFLHGTHRFEPTGLPTPEWPAVPLDHFDIVVTIEPGAEPAGVPQERVLRLDHGRPREEEALADLAAELHSLWLEGASVLIRSRHAVNRGPLVAALILCRVGVDASVAVQLIHNVRSEWSFCDEPALRWMLGLETVPGTRVTGGSG